MRVKVLSPERLAYEAEDVDEVFLPGDGGDMVVMPDHTPLLSSLRIGSVEIRKAGETTRLAVAGGFFEVTREGVHVIADAAERSEEIDVNRARDAKSRAEERLQQASAKHVDVDTEKARSALERALNRLSVASGRRPS